MSFDPNGFGAIVTLDITMLEKLSRELHISVSKVIKAIAFALEAKIKTNNVPYDTGAMVNSIHVRMQGHDGETKAEAAALQRNWLVEFDPLPWPEMLDGAVVGVSVNYAAYVELGTYKMAAQPFFFPVVDWFDRNVMNNPNTWKELFEP